MTKEKFNDLLSKIRRGNKSAFATLYNTFYSKMFYVAECISGNREDARDAVQQAFVRIWRYVIENGHPYIEYPNAFIFTITKHCAIDVVNNTKQYTPCESDDTLATDDLYEERQIIKTDIKEAFAALKEPEQTVAMQFFVFDMKIREIAESLGEPIGTVKWRINEIRKFFKKILK